MVVELLALLFLAGRTSHPICSVDTQAMIELDFQAFDQDMKGGWRVLAYDPACQSVAADLIAQYRRRHPNGPTTLAWHEGQVRLGMGQNRRAIALFNKSRHPPLPDAINDGWNPYVDATIAFARRDLKALRKARAQLAALPLPPKFPAEVKWPMNLDVVDGLITCFGKPYMIAYGQDCRPKRAK